MNAFGDPSLRAIQAHVSAHPKNAGARRQKCWCAGRPHPPDAVIEIPLCPMRIVAFLGAAAISAAAPSHLVRANCRADSQAAEYHTSGRSPGYRSANSRFKRASRRALMRALALEEGVCEV